MRGRDRGKKLLCLVFLAQTTLWGVACPSGTGQFLAPVLQPVVGGILQEFGNAFTTAVLGQQQP